VTNWRNRIIGLENHKPGEIADHPLQWRTHSAHQQSALRGVLEEVGIAGALLVYRSNGLLYATRICLHRHALSLCSLAVGLGDET